MHHPRAGHEHITWTMRRDEILDGSTHLLFISDVSAEGADLGTELAYGTGRHSQLIGVTSN